MVFRMFEVNPDFIVVFSNDAGKLLDMAMGFHGESTDPMIEHNFRVLFEVGVKEWGMVQFAIDKKTGVMGAKGVKDVEAGLAGFKDFDPREIFLN